MYKIKILPSAQKDFDHLQGKIFNNIKNRIVQLADNPRPYGALKLTNDEGYRIRIGDYRLLYRIDDKLREIFIYRIKHRKEVYR
jgi:mRNA interferase RelE/StbE